MAIGRWRLSGLLAPVEARAQWALDIADANDIPVTVTSGFRGLDEQARLRARWEAGLSPWPANRPGDSAHNFGLAFDSDVPDDWMPAWAWIRRLLGFEIPSNDIIHAQVPAWRRLLR